jgi:hypothetical protein
VAHVRVLREGLDGLARLARDEEERPVEPARGLDVVDGGGIGGIEDVQGRRAGPRDRDDLEHLGGKARAAHAQKEDPREAGISDLGGKRIELVDLAREPLRSVEPAEAIPDDGRVRFVALPERGIAVHQTLKRARPGELVERLTEVGFERAERFHLNDGARGHVGISPCSGSARSR